MDIKTIFQFINLKFLTSVFYLNSLLDYGYFNDLLREKKHLMYCRNTKLHRTRDIVNITRRKLHALKQK